MIIEKLVNPVQNYPWGHREYIPHFLGAPETEGPQAELWMGTHPKGASRVGGAEDQSLPSFLADKGLGRGELSFLMKLIAVEKPLSIQVHPSKEQAQRGFVREQRMGIPPDSPLRNYKDPNHKPEILYSFTPFYAMVGLRPKNETRDLVKALELSPDNWRYMERLVKYLEFGDHAKAFELMLSSDVPDIHDLHRALAQYAESAPAAAGVIMNQVLDHFPHDRGLLMPLFLNNVYLEPGQVLYTGAGVIHAYVKGFGLELMASSDNVLRGGLTGKHMDVHELLSVGNFSPSAPQLLPGKVLSPGLWEYPSPAQDFTLRRFEVVRGHGVKLELGGPWILLVEDGSIELVVGTRRTKFSKGETAIIVGDPSPVTITGGGSGFLSSGKIL